MKKKQINLDGGQLVEDFRSALLIRSTAEVASQEAKISEEETLQGLDEISRGAYLNPTFIPEATQEALTRASVDAHIKRVQAKQIGEQSQYKLIDMQEEVDKKYKGMNVKVIVLNRDAKPIESIWQDPNTGEFYPSTVNTKGLSGKIEAIMLEKNSIALKPGMIANLGSSNRKLFMIYVIDPQTMEPLVDLQF
ncbi:hypothetical protein KDA00_03205 [Candidatus Saccharibacteria bacterium]|nr:hypothetical protein [Candidatus Saccharibacteria bacterium]